MKASPEDVEACRDRDGAAAPDRPDHVEDALEPDPLLGFQNGAPLADRPYNEYPDDYYANPEDVSDFLEELAGHPLIVSTSALAEELRIDENTAADICNLYDIDLPANGFDVRVSEKPSDALVMPNGEQWPMDYLADDPATDPRVLGQLLATDGLSCEEAAEYLESELRRIRGGPNVGRGAWKVRPHEVRSAARDYGLI